MSRPPHPPRLYNSNYTWRRVRFPLPVFIPTAVPFSLIIPSSTLSSLDTDSKENKCRNRLEHRKCSVSFRSFIRSLAISKQQKPVNLRCLYACVYRKNKQTNSVALSPQWKFTDLSTATCQRNLVPTFVDRGVSRGQRGGSPTAVNFSFVDGSRYYFFQVAPHLLSQGLSGPRSRPTATQKIW
jgi:hypothetical protein